MKREIAPGTVVFENALMPGAFFVSRIFGLGIFALLFHRQRCITAFYANMMKRKPLRKIYYKRQNYVWNIL